MQKHKSKYKQPKDFEKSQKPQTRKDLKDYTVEDKNGKMNPYSTEEKQTNVLRKTDKPFEESENMIPKNKSHYYKLNGDHDPKYTAKKRKEYQDDEESSLKDSADKLKRSLTREQKEYFIQEYIRRRVKKKLQEQAEEDTTAAPEPAPEPQAVDTTAAPEPAPAPETQATDTADETEEQVNTNSITDALSSSKSIVDAARLITSGITGYIDSLPEETKTTAKNKFYQLLQKYINTNRAIVQQ